MRDDYLAVIFLTIVFSVGLLAGNSRSPAFAAGFQGDPVVTRSYVEEAVDKYLAPVQQEIERAHIRLHALEKRLNAVKGTVPLT